MEDEPMITHQQAVDFVANNLKISNFEEMVQKDRLRALNNVIRAFLAEYPFQDVDLMATPGAERRVPTPLDMIKSHYSGKGGLCITLNSFIVHVINQFGYTAYNTGAHVVGTDPDTHVVAIVNDLLEPGDLYLIDVGSGYPSYQAVPLQGKPQIYKDSFLEWTIVKNGDQYSRYHLKGDDRVFLDGDGIPPDEKKFYDFRPIPRSYSFFLHTLHETYTDESHSIFLKNIYVAIYPPGKGVTIKMDKLRIFDDATNKLTTQTLTKYDDYLQVLREYKLTFDEEELRKAVDMYFQSKAQGTLTNGH